MNTPPKPQYVPNALRLLQERFGVRCWLDDPDGQTIGIETRDISAAELRAVLLEYSDAIRTQLYYDRRQTMAVFVGGPLNGQHHGRYCPNRGQVFAEHIAACKWAVYVVDGDQLRAFFRGYATSRKKALRLELTPRNATEANHGEHGWHGEEPGEDQGA